ncbi:MAG TPA: molybdate ABC transporter substrate-binding protein [Candidatus Limnocylindrales bacterium]|nr:molybdate ABC transporter substrate-binding protein [Candidatus Limnocylindrales bacterium]
MTQPGVAGRRARLVATAAIAVLALAACSAATASPGPTATSTLVPAPTEPTELTIFGAASLQDLLDAAKTAYESTHDGVTLVISTDSSAALEAKIEQGAPADLFLSADTANPQTLVDEGLAVGEAVSFAANELAIIVPTDNPARIESAADLAEDGVRIIAAGDEVPITRYATRLVDRLAALPGYPAGFARAYAANVLSREENVRAVVAKIELGEGDAGIVYATDATVSTSVKAIRVPPEANIQATYAAVVVKGSAHEGEAQAFLMWLTGPEGLSILQGLGFLPPPE